MPNRIIKESICISDDIAKLSDKEEILFYRLIVQCDDFGIFDGRPAIVRSKCFPLKLDKISEKDVEKWLANLESAGMIAFYTAQGRQYLRMVSWSKHQQIRAKRSKYPQPIEADNTCNQLISNDCICPRESESESESESIDSSEQQVAAEPPAIVIPLVDGSGFPISQKQIDKWSALYQAVDVLQELRKMIGWCDANPKRRKTKRGVMAFIARWLSSSQDNAYKPVMPQRLARAPTETDFGWGQDESKLPDFMKGRDGS